MEDIQYNKKPFVIIGAGGLGREMYSWLSQDSSFSSKYSCEGFIDDTLEKLDLTNYPKVIDIISGNDFSKYSSVLIAVANSNFRESVLGAIDSQHTKVLGYVHESVLIGKNTVLDDSVIVLPNAIISCDAIVGKSVFINNGTQVGHDVRIGDYANIMANVDIGGHCIIGNNVTIGSGAVILPKLTIPDNTTIGAGSVVIRKIKEAGTYFGNPAKRIL